MNLRFVEAFHWALALGSVTRAAEKLHVTQSALSSRIASLEEELGVLLLDRRDKQLRPTMAGVRFHALAQRLLALQREIRTEFGAGAGIAGRAMVLRIGAIESVVHTWLIGWLREMRAAHPGFELDLTVETTPVLVEQALRGALDLVFAALPAAGSGMRVHALPPMEMVFVGHRELHAPRRRRWTLAQVAAHELLTFQRGSQPHMALLETLRRAGGPLPRVHAISSISAIAELVEGGFGIAVLPRAAAERLALHQPLRVLRCQTPLAPLPIHASLRDDPTSPLAQQVLDSALAWVGPAKVPGRTGVAHRKNR